MEEELWRLGAAALGGGFALKLLETVYGEFKHWLSQRSASIRSITSNLEPLLKSADELVGKLTSLGRQDFLPLRRSHSKDISDDEILGVTFLFVQFWAWFELFRIAYYDNEVGGSRKGKQLTKFYDCLESRDIRIVERLYQRALGEATASVDRSPSILDFAEMYGKDANFRRWLDPLVSFLSNLDEPKSRQRLLRYNTILHAMIDCLDKKHRITRDRPALPNKLSRRSLRDLKYRWFGRYLTFIEKKQVEKYIGPPDGRP